MNFCFVLYIQGCRGFSGATSSYLSRDGKMTFSGVFPSMISRLPICCCRALGVGAWARLFNSGSRYGNLVSRQFNGY